jgi:nucleotide-binding universal stress UspA family protein
VSFDLDGRPVVIAVDLGPSTAEVLAHGRAIADIEGRPIVVVHVRPPFAMSPRWLVDHPPLGLVRSAGLNTAVSVAVEQLAETVGGQPLVVNGDPADEISRLVDRIEAAVAVVGGAEARIGAVAQELIRRAALRVLVARTAAPDGPIIAATDLADGAIPEIVAAAELADRRLAYLEVLHVIEPTGPAGRSARAYTADDVTAAESAVRARIRRLGLEARVSSVVGHASSEIIAEGAARAAQLVVIGSHSPPLRPRWHPMTAADVAARATTAVLVVPLARDAPTRA